MKTKKCKHCKEEIAKDAKRCPKCGGKQGMPGWTKAIIIIIIEFQQRITDYLEELLEIIEQEIIPLKTL